MVAEEVHDDELDGQCTGTADVPVTRRGSGGDGERDGDGDGASMVVANGNAFLVLVITTADGATCGSMEVANGGIRRVLEAAGTNAVGCCDCVVVLAVHGVSRGGPLTGACAGM